MGKEDSPDFDLSAENEPVDAQKAPADDEQKSPVKTESAESEDDVKMPKRPRRSTRRESVIANKWLILSGLLLFFAGFFLGHFWAPLNGFIDAYIWPTFKPIGDGMFKSLLTSPISAGALALLAALIALIPARIQIKIARESARNTDWWNRAEWAFDKSTAKEIDEQKAGLIACENLIWESTWRQDALVYHVANSILHPEEYQKKQRHSGRG